MNKTLSKSKNKKIVGGNNFTFSALSFDNNINRTEFEAKKENINVKLIFYKKKDTPLSIKEVDIKDDRNLKIITSNITDAKYYEPNTGNNNGELNKNKIVENMNKFDTCVIVVFENICYIFLYVNTSGYGNGAIKEFDKNIEKYNLKALDALMIAHFKKLKLNIIFVNNFLAVVKGYIDGHQNQAVKPKQTTTELDETTSDQGGAQEGGKKINTNKILNNLILKLSKINNVKNFSETKATKPTKPKATKPTKPKATKPTKPNLTKPKVIKPTKPKATKPTKPKPSKPKVTKPKATKKI